MRVPAAYVWTYRLAAISNFLVTLPAFFTYDWYVGQFHAEAPNYPFLVWIWSGMAFLWGVMFWEVSRDVVQRREMLKYTWLEKSVTSTSVLVAYLTGNVPVSFLASIIYTDIFWIPLFLWVHVGTLRLVRSRGDATVEASGSATVDARPVA